MGLYSVSRSNVALSTTDDLMTLIAAASRRVKIWEISVGGMGTVNAANELVLARSTGGTTGGGALTPSLVETDQLAAETDVFTTWSAQPTLGDVLLRLPVNANGGIYRWVARPGEEFEARDAEQLSLRSAVGTSNVSVHVIFEEL
jgi:hypothetical protein